MFGPLEMVSRYRQAKDKRAQLKIFEECNLIDRDEVIRIMLEHGLRRQELPRNRKDPRGAKKGENRRMKRPVEDKVLEAIEAEFAQEPDESIQAEVVIISPPDPEPVDPMDAALTYMEDLGNELRKLDRARAEIIAKITRLHKALHAIEPDDVEVE